MKYIISEEQSYRVNNVVRSLYKDDYNMIEINKITGIPMDNIVDALIDERLYEHEYEFHKCENFYDAFFTIFKSTNKLLHRFEYDDGSLIILDYDSVSGSIGYDYSDNKNVKLFGYATPFWDGVCVIPVDMEEYTLGEDWVYEHIYHRISLEGITRKIKTYGDLITFFNEEYFRLLKVVLDSFAETVKTL